MSHINYEDNTYFPLSKLKTAKRSDEVPLKLQRYADLLGEIHYSINMHYAINIRVVKNAIHRRNLVESSRCIASETRNAHAIPPLFRSIRSIKCDTINVSVGVSFAFRLAP